ncbi:MAG: DUF58 domain-containing protein [Thermotogaceae bacterium]|jgi:uncharacterized protein (DUF58 family)|nr:DUF58 domain-containing protein [Thermotogaceae bacterium]
MRELRFDSLISRKRPLFMFSMAVLVWIIMSVDTFSLMIGSLVILLWIHYYFVVISVKRLNIIRTIDRERLFPGEYLTLKYSISATSPMRLELIATPTLVGRYDFASTKGEKVVVGSEHAVSFQYTVSFRRHGEKDISKLEILYRDPTKLFTLMVTYSLKEKILILPRITDPGNFPIRLRELLPGKESDFKLMEDLTDFRGIRVYDREPLNRIHWKASARMGRLYSKEFGFTAVSKTFLYLDLNLSDEVFARDVWERIRVDYEETAIEVAGSLIRKILTDSGRLTLVTVGEKVSYTDDTGRDWIDFFEVLSMAHGCEKGPSFSEYISRDMGRYDPATTVVVLSLYLGESVLPDLVKARSRASRVVVLLMPFGLRKPGQLPGKSYQMLPMAMEELKRRSSLLEEEQIIVRVVEENRSLAETFGEVCKHR